METNKTTEKIPDQKKPKSDNKSPGFWFYTADYERDMQILSLAAQGLWSRMLCWMSDNEAHRGFAELPTGQPMDKWDIASRVGKTIREVDKLLIEMERVGTYSIDNRGCIFCRRMARDHHISSVRKIAAKSRMDNATRAANGEFAGDFAGTKHPAKEKQNPTVTAPVPDSASVSVSTSKTPCAIPSEFAPVETPSLFPDESTGNGEIPPIPHENSATSAPGRQWFDTQHDRWYKAYWRKVNPKLSRKAFERRVRALKGKREFQQWIDVVEFLLQQVSDDRARFEVTRDWDWRQNLLPTTWLNGERWQDQPVASEPRSRQTNSVLQGMINTHGVAK